MPTAKLNAKPIKTTCPKLNDALAITTPQYTVVLLQNLLSNQKPEVSRYTDPIQPLIPSEPKKTRSVDCDRSYSPDVQPIAVLSAPYKKYDRADS